MDFTLDAKQQELVNLAKEIAQKEIAPRALDIDKSGVMDPELLKILKQSGRWQRQVLWEFPFRRNMAEQDSIC